MTATAPQIRTLDKIKSSLLQPALTSHYECFFAIPRLVDTFINQGGVTGTSKQELLMLSCSEASLPGSQLNTHELNNDFTGVTQRHAYRRLYDDRADFTFYVNNTYSQILIFESWIQYISGEQQSGSERLNNFYRVKYPIKYKTDIYLTKFERTAKPKIGKDIDTNGASYSSQKLYYSFFNAFPISITSMPVSYDSSSLLKCSISFTYDRYVCSNRTSSTGVPGQPSTPDTATGVPNPNSNIETSNLYAQASSPEAQSNLNAAYTQNLNLSNYTGTPNLNSNFESFFGNNNSDPTRVFQQANIDQIASRSFG